MPELEKLHNTLVTEIQKHVEMIAKFQRGNPSFDDIQRNLELLLKTYTTFKF